MAKPKVYGFSDEATAKKLKRLANKSQGKETKGNGYETLEGGGIARKLPSIRAYIMVPVTAIPAATTLNGKVYLGYGLACLYKRKNSREDNDTASMFPDSVIYDTNIEVVKEESSPVQFRVFNFTAESITVIGDCEKTTCGDSVIFVVQDMWGDLYIVNKTEFPQCSSSSSTSTSESYSDSHSDSEPSSSISDSYSDSVSDSISISVSDSISESHSIDRCDYTGQVIVGGAINRYDNVLTQSITVLTFENGLLCDSRPGGNVVLDICCEPSDSGNDTSISHDQTSFSGPCIPPTNGETPGFTYTANGAGYDIDLSWAPSMGSPVIRYRVFRNGVQIGDTSSTSFQDYGPCGVTWYYQIIPYNNCGVGNPGPGIANLPAC